MRETVLTIPAGPAPVSQRLGLIRDERHRVTLPGFEDEPMVMTLATEAGGAPRIEIPGTGGFDLTPAVLQLMPEGASWPFNIWRAPGEGQMLLVTGQVSMSPSIAPLGGDVISGILSGLGQPGGPARVVALTRSAYAALAAPRADTIYLVTPEEA